MGFYDVVMLVILGGCVFFGFWKGLTWQIASLSAIVVSYIVSINFREPVSQFIQTEAPWNRIGAMLILFLGTSIVIWTIYSRIKSRIKKLELGGFDRQAGALLGAVKGGILCMVVTMFSVSLLGASANEAIQTSKFGPYIEDAIIKAPSIVPAEVANLIQGHIENYKQNRGYVPNPANPNPANPNPTGWPNAGTQLTGGGTYPVQGGLNQNPTSLPPANQAGYQGGWAWQNTPATQANTQQQQFNQQQQYNQQQQQQFNQQQQQQQFNQQQQFGQQRFNQPTQQPQSNWNSNNWNTPNTPAGAQTGTNYGVGGNQTTNSPFNGPSEDLLEGFNQLKGQALDQARQMGQQAVEEAAKRAFENTFQGQQR